MNLLGNGTGKLDKEESQTLDTKKNIIIGIHSFNIYLLQVPALSCCLGGRKHNIILFKYLFPFCKPGSGNVNALKSLFCRGGPGPNSGFELTS